jgi:hypothetical protein
MVAKLREIPCLNLKNLPYAAWGMVARKSANLITVLEESKSQHPRIVISSVLPGELCRMRDGMPRRKGVAAVLSNHYYFVIS